MTSRFQGEHPQQYAYWAHNMARVASVTLVALGLFGALWTTSGTYDCQVRGRPISRKLIRRGQVVGGVNGTCVVGTAPAAARNTTTFGEAHFRPACCDPRGPASESENLGGSYVVGATCLVGGAAAFLLESPTSGIGLWQPTDWVFYSLRIAPQFLLLGGLGVYALFTRATCLAGSVSYTHLTLPTKA